jgi:hypothetical protein
MSMGRILLEKIGLIDARESNEDETSEAEIHLDEVSEEAERRIRLANYETLRIQRKMISWEELYGRSER